MGSDKMGCTHFTTTQTSSHMHCFQPFALLHLNRFVSFVVVVVAIKHKIETTYLSTNFPPSFNLTNKSKQDPILCFFCLKDVRSRPIGKHHGQHRRHADPANHGHNPKRRRVRFHSREQIHPKEPRDQTPKTHN